MGQAQTKNKNRNVLKFESKEEYFIQNGGILLEKFIALSPGQDKGAGQLRILSALDVENATNCYEPNIVSGSTASMMVYKGILDESVVAICGPQNHRPNPELVNFFLTEASVGMVMHHKNMVKLYGCCLETCIPILVFEFIPNNSLFENLHGSHALRNNLKWADRLRIVTDVSYALSYMHNALPKPVVHRDVQSHSILLDNLCAKLANLGYSVPITPGESSRKWPVQGTSGYIDPEYVETREVTDKCDVYSFGVLLLEVLSKEHPPTLARDGMDLVDVFVSAMENNHIPEIMDRDVLDQASSDEIEQVTRLALACVAKKGVDRPTMVEVVSKLWQIQGQYNARFATCNLQRESAIHLRYIGEGLILIYSFWLLDKST